eukprot:SAG31_NODE_140_length_22731_cov_10.941410_13_plen_157_part_00
MKLPPLVSSFLDLTDRIAALLSPAPTNQNLRPTAILGTVCLALGLGALGLLSLCAPDLAAEAYGITAPLGPGQGWVRAAGLRDFGFAVAALCILRGSPESLPAFLPGVLLIPAGDIAIVCAHGNVGWQALLPHVAGVFAVGVLLVSALVRPSNKLI